MARGVIKKVIATVEEIYSEPEYRAIYKCPYCGAKDGEEVFSDNCTEKVTCYKCEKEFKVKIPKGAIS